MRERPTMSLQLTMDSCTFLNSVAFWRRNYATQRAIVSAVCRSWRAICFQSSRIEIWRAPGWR